MFHCTTFFISYFHFCCDVVITPIWGFVFLYSHIFHISNLSLHFRRHKTFLQVFDLLYVSWKGLCRKKHLISILASLKKKITFYSKCILPIYWKSCFHSCKYEMSWAHYLQINNWPAFVTVPLINVISPHTKSALL